ncbi:MAG: hypothetical protein V5A20_01810 [Salinibacter sp.]|jgi:hypothetical protein|uniref:hypothetical protein n=1 Tax=Salinibacter sp. TaxID=2065818 RepID=UPI002FC3072D
MQDPFLSIRGRLLGAVLLMGGAWALGGCDTVPAPEETQRPSVSNLQLVPDSLHQSDLSPDQVRDSLARDTLVIGVQATDPDGSVERVVSVIEPSSNPRRVLSTRLPPVEETLYGAGVPLTLPLVDEIYTVRVFAVDDDSLSSNQVTGQFRFVPTDTAEATGDSDALRRQVNGRPDDS